MCGVTGVVVGCAGDVVVLLLEGLGRGVIVDIVEINYSTDITFFIIVVSAINVVIM